MRHFGFPEVFLGLFPAWGGTQLTPRLIGPEHAVKLVVTNPLSQNRMLKARDAVELGLAERVLEPVELVDESIAFALELVETPIERGEPDWSELETIMRRARTDVDDAVHGASPAPYRALDLIEGAATWTIEEGYRQEEAGDRGAPARGRRRRRPSTPSASSSGGRSASPTSEPSRGRCGRSESSAPG